MRTAGKSNFPLVTVVVCTYNRAYILAECLASLVSQTTPLDQFEILVIDNNSTDDTHKVAAEFCDRVPDARVVFEPSQGLSHARNRGLAEAQSEWIAFIDDDAKAHPGWVASILSTIAKNDFDAFGGPYYAWHRFGTPPAWLPESFGTYLGSPTYGPLGIHHIPGGNCAFKKQAVIDAGAFPVELGMAGHKCAYGEETLVFNRLKASGNRLGFVPDMRIDHCVLPHKYTLRWQLSSAFASGRDAPYAFNEKSSLPRLFRTCWACIEAFCKFLYVCCGIWKTQRKKTIFVAARQAVTNVGNMYALFCMLATKDSTCPRP